MSLRHPVKMMTDVFKWGINRGLCMKCFGKSILIYIDIHKYIYTYAHVYIYICMYIYNLHMYIHIVK